MDVDLDLTPDRDRSLRSVATSVFAVGRERGVSLMAAGLAFYLFNSLIPLLLFVIVGATTFGWMESAIGLMETAVGVDADRFLSAMESVIGEGAGRGRAVAIAVVILAWSAFTTVQSMNMAFGLVYGSRKDRSKLAMVVNSLLALAALVVAIVVLGFVGVSLVLATDDLVVRLASVPLLFATVFCVFLPMYHRFPQPATTVREALPGAILAALAWTLCAVGFRVYVVTAESVELYGVIGGVMLLLTWLYVGCLALLLGVILNAVLADRVEADDAWTVGA